MIKDETFISEMRERFAHMPRTIKRGCSRALKKISAKAKATGAAAVVAGGLVFGGPGVQLAQATPPPPVEWTASPLEVDWGSIGLGIGGIVLAALVIWAGVYTVIRVFKALTRRVSSTV